MDRLAERADVNGCRLVGIARQLDLGLVRGIEAEQMGHWSGQLKQIAVEHLQCINAISLDALQRVQAGPVHLGDWRRSDRDKRVDPDRMCRWGDRAAREDFVQHRNSHHG